MTGDGDDRKYDLCYRHVEFSLAELCPDVCLLCGFITAVAYHNLIIRHFSYVATCFQGTKYQNLVFTMEFSFTVEFTFTLKLKNVTDNENVEGIIFSEKQKSTGIRFSLKPASNAEKLWKG